jgi:hypothetical protein
MCACACNEWAFLCLVLCKARGVFGMGGEKSSSRFGGGRGGEVSASASLSCAHMSCHTRTHPTPPVVMYARPMQFIARIINRINPKGLALGEWKKYGRARLAYPARPSCNSPRSHREKRKRGPLCPPIRKHTTSLRCYINRALGGTISYSILTERSEQPKV